MKIKEVMGNVNEFFSEQVAPPHKITSIEAAEEEGWKVILEVIEEKDYMKKYAKDEMVGIYHVRVDKDGDVTSFSRKSTRYRSALEIEE